MVKNQRGEYSSTSPIKDAKYFVRLILNILWYNFCDLHDRELPSISWNNIEKIPAKSTLFSLRKVALT